MNNFLSLKDLTNEQIMELIRQSLSYKNKEIAIPDYSSKIVSMLFLESSTRTKSSFEIALNKMNIYPLNIEEKSSALQKGESLQDTLNTLSSLEVSSIIIRSEIEKYYENINTTNLKIINAGDGAHEHPSQSLLDLVTIYENFNKFDNLNILIMGDILHSRVAKSNVHIMERLGMNVDVYAPDFFKANENEYNYINEIETNLKKYDVVMLLRNQLERHKNKIPNLQEIYLEKYGMSDKRFEYLKDDAILMHPGPFNRDVELSSTILDEKKVKINEQVTNGLYSRIAIIDYVLGEK